MRFGSWNLSCHPGLDPGSRVVSEEFRRPILILKKFNQYAVLAVPLSTKIKKNKYYVPVDLHDGIARMAIISQVRLIDAKRFIDKIGTVDEISFVQIKNAVKAML